MVQVYGFVLLVSLLGVLSVSAQSPETTQGPPDNIMQFRLKVHGGAVLIHSQELAPVRNSYPRGVELDFVRHKIGQRAWESCHCYPRVGLSMSYWDFDQPDILGQAVMGIFYVEPVFNAWRRVSYSVRAGTGFTWQNRPYDPQQNPLNQSYSTRVAFPLHISFLQHIRLSPQWVADLTVTYNHLSNGGFREPNKGVNWPGVGLGIGYYPQAPVFVNRGKDDWRSTMTRRFRYEVSAFVGFKEPVSKAYIFSPGLEVKAARRIARASNLSLGMEWIHDNALAFHIRRDEGNASPQRLSVAVGHEFILGKFFFSQQFGWYAWKPYSRGADVWQRYGLIYPVWRNVYVGSNLKVHGHVSQQLDLRITTVF